MFVQEMRKLGRKSGDERMAWYLKVGKNHVERIMSREPLIVGWRGGVTEVPWAIDRLV